MAVVCTFLVVSGTLRDIAAGADSYGELVAVAVATSDLDPGTTVEPHHVTVTHLPRSLVPDAAFATPPLGRVVRHPIAGGEALLPARVAPEGTVGVAAQLLPGERAIAVPLPGHRAPLQLGQRVDVLSTADLGVGGRPPSTTVVARDAVVLHLDEHGVTLAVDAANASAIATALVQGPITITLSG